MACRTVKVPGGEACDCKGGYLEGRLCPRCGRVPGEPALHLVECEYPAPGDFGGIDRCPDRGDVDTHGCPPCRARAGRSA